MRQFWNFEPGARSRIRHQRAFASRTAEHADAPSAAVTPYETIAGEDADGIDQLVDTPNRDDTALTKCRVDDICRAGKRARMGGRRALRNFRPAALENNQRFVSGRRFKGHLEQLLRLLESFDEAGDRAGVWVFNQIVKILLHRSACLIAARDDVAQTNMAV